MRPAALSATLALALHATACAPVAPSPALSPRASADPAPGWQVHTPAGPAELYALDAALAQARVVMLAERHDDATDHAAQAFALDRVLATARPVRIGLEMVQVHHQPALDDFCAGRIDEAALLEALDWPRTWGLDFALYRPLFEACRRHDDVALLALSPALDQVRQLARQGPSEVETETVRDSGFDAHRRYVLRALGAHAHAHAGFDPERFYAAQLYRDEHMAAVMDAALAQAPDAVGVLIAGRGHLEHHLGVPARLDAAPALVVVPLSAGEVPAPDYEGHPQADWYLRPAAPAL